MTKDQKRRLNKAFDFAQKTVKAHSELSKLPGIAAAAMSSAVSINLEMHMRQTPHTIYKADGKGIDKRRARRYWRKHMKPKPGAEIVNVNCE